MENVRGKKLIFSTQNSTAKGHGDIRQGRLLLSMAFGCLMRQNIWPVVIWLFYYVSRQLQNPFSNQIPVDLILTELSASPLSVSLT